MKNVYGVMALMVVIAMGLSFLLSSLVVWVISAVFGFTFAWKWVFLFWLILLVLKYYMKKNKVKA